MNQEELKQYVIYICQELGFDFTQEVESLQIDIDEQWRYRFHHTEEVILFEDEITLENYFIQTLLEMWFEKKEQRVVNVRGESACYFVYKTTIRNHFVDEYIKAYRYDPVDDTVSEIDLSFIYTLLERNNDKPSSKSDNLILRKAEQKVSEKTRKDAIVFMRQKQEEWKPTLQKEIRRIKEYYLLVRQEHLNTYSEHTYADYEVVESEKEHLIRQQLEKYRYKLEDAEINPLLVIYSSNN